MSMLRYVKTALSVKLLQHNIVPELLHTDVRSNAPTIIGPLRFGSKQQLG